MRRRDLSAEERALWRKIARSANPLDEARLQRLDDPAPPPKKAKPQSEAPIKTGGMRLSSADAQKVNRPARPADRGGEKRLRRGKVEIDARIDLHGMTQAAALNSLTGFLHSARRRGCACVLVITGKGVMTKPRDHAPWEYPEAPGVLRRKLPEWLARPDLAPLVSGYATAHARHGGTGAFYVMMRKF